MDPGLIAAIVVACLVVLFLAGVPVFAALGLASMAGIVLLQGVGGLSAVPGVIYDRLSGFTLVAVPLFILMGEIIFVTGIGGDIYTAASRWTSGLHGSLGMASIAACTVFSALCGVSVAGAATIGKFAIPEMLKRGYDPALATGCVAAAGSLALMIPPSVGLILYGLVADESVGLLFIAGIVPGLILAALMMAYVFVLAKLRPHLAPGAREAISWRMRFEALARIWPVAVLVVLVMGSIYLGIATPTEAAAVGSVGALAFAAHRRQLSGALVRRILRETMIHTGMILMILAAALLFGYVLTRLRVPQQLVLLITGADLPAWLVLVMVFSLLIVMGTVMDVVSVILISTPILLPVITALGYDRLWFGIVMTVTCEMAVITPPVGLNLFVIKGVAPPEVSLADVVRGAAPFVGVLMVGLGIFVAFPELVLWLPFLKF